MSPAREVANADLVAAIRASRSVAEVARAFSIPNSVIYYRAKRDPAVAAALEAHRRAKAPGPCKWCGVQTKRRGLTFCSHECRWAFARDAAAPAKGAARPAQQS